MEIFARRKRNGNDDAQDGHKMRGSEAARTEQLSAPEKNERAEY